MAKVLRKAPHKRTGEWCVEFWDFGAWDEFAGTRMKYKAQAIDLAQKMNRETTDRSCFEGHRFRVRKAKD